MEIEMAIKALASGLIVQKNSEERTIVSRTYAPAEKQQKFVTVLSEHLSRKAKELDIGQLIHYSYYLGKAVNSSEIADSIVESIDNNLQEVLKALPKLDESETYSFPAQTAITFRCVDQKSGTVEVASICKWIQNMF